jgi:ubiquinone biosynthesis accessory factor UbiK
MPMEPARLIEEVNARLSELLAANPAQDVERNVKALVASALERLELATREEFDVQARVLARSREKLEHLEARVAELEQRLRSGD